MTYLINGSLPQWERPAKEPAHKAALLISRHTITTGSSHYFAGVRNASVHALAAFASAAAYPCVKETVNTEAIQRVKITGRTISVSLDPDVRFNKFTYPISALVQRPGIRFALRSSLFSTQAQSPIGDCEKVLGDPPMEIVL